jgi:multidrug efflux system outer membrane protein
MPIKRPFRWPVVPLVLPLLAAGCSLAPDYQSPDTPVPAAWSAPGINVRSQGPDGATVWPDVAWWRGFDDPSLNALITLAQRNNATIDAAVARIVQADAQARAAGAGLWPELSASVDTGRTWRDSGRGVQGSMAYGAALGASYQIDLFGGVRSTADAARIGAELSRYDRETVALSVVSGVAGTYFQVLQFRNRLTVALRNLEIAENVLNLVEARVNAGAASPLDLYQQRTTIAGQRAALPPLETQERQAANALSILIGEMPLNTRVDDAWLLEITPPPVAAGMPSELLTRRPDIRTAEARLRAANAQIAVARASFFPAVSLTGRFGQASDVFATLLDPVNTTFSLGVGLAETIFDGGLHEAQLDVANARRDELLHNYRQAVLTAFADVENALIAGNNAQSREALQLDAVEQAREAYRLAEARYREGATDLLSVLDAQRSLYQAEDQVVQARFERLQAAVNLFSALGGGWAAGNTVP